MIRSLVLAALLAGPPALAQADAGVGAVSVAPLDADGGVREGPPVPDEAALEKYRTPLEVLTERAIGEASRAVRFDWRRSTVGFGVVGSQLIELNNFVSGRVGGFVRTPLGGFLGELAVTRVFTSGSAATDQLTYTPYRQNARPSRVELDLNLGYPLAEGVVTPRFSFLPPMEMVFSANAGLRYLYYPGSLSNLSAGDVLKGLFAPQLSQAELDNLEGQRLGGMAIDPARYSLLLGFSGDVYFQNGVFFSPRVLLALPVFGGGLGVWWELSLALGWAF
jgi:hypothetical protein